MQITVHIQLLNHYTISNILDIAHLPYVELSHVTLCKKESQLQSKKTDFSQEKSRKSQKKVKKFDFSFTFLD